VGELPGHHAAVGIKPGSGYGVVILQSGPGNISPEDMAYTVFDIMQPAFDGALEERAEELYAGVWRSVFPHSGESGSPGQQPMGEESEARIAVRDGTLWMETLTLRGEEMLDRLFNRRERGVPLQSTGRVDEMRYDLPHSQSFLRIHRRGFRLDAGPLRPGLHGTVYMGCMAHWAFLDDWGMRNGAGHNLVYFTGGPGTNEERLLHYPAAKVTMRRV
jgi:hypothetical protein